MRNFTLPLAIVLFLGTCLSGQNLIDRTKDGLSCSSTIEPNEISKKFDLSKSFKSLDLFSWDNRKAIYDWDEVNLTINRDMINALFNNTSEQFSLDIPVNQDQAFTVDLYRVNIRSKYSKLLSPEGEVSRTNKMVFYRGVVRGDHGSIVSLSVINNDVRLGIFDRDGVYRVTPADFKSDNYALWIDESTQEKDFECGSSGEYYLGTTQHYELSESSNSDKSQKALSDIVQVYVECDRELYIDKGGFSGAEAFVSDLFAEIIALYANENINMEVSDIFVWSSNDPYRGNSNLASVLPLFGQNTQNDFNGQIATLLKGNTTSSCSISGLAWVDVLCNSYNSNQHSGPYNVNQGVGYCPLNSNPTSLFDALDVSLVAHEIGHNIASPHTHGCCWGPNGNQAIDQCPGSNQSCTTGAAASCSEISGLPSSEIGTIMSYCNDVNVFTKGFGSHPGDLMRNRVSAASCLAQGGQSCTENNLTYNNVTVPNNTTEYVDNNITLNNTVSIVSNGNVFWQMGNQLTVNGIFTVPESSDLEILVEECQ